MGVNFIVAWIGAVEYARVSAGEAIGIFGIGGGVGGAVAQIAHHIGARVIGIDRKPPPAASPAAQVMELFLDSSAPDLAQKVASATGGKGVAVVFDTVGGVVFESALRCLAPRGRLVEISATGKRRVEFDLVDFYHRELRLFGADSRKYDLEASSRLLTGVASGFATGHYKPPVIAARYTLEEGRAAYEAVAQGTPGRVVLLP